MQRDPFFDDGVVTADERTVENQTPPIPASRKTLPNDAKTNEVIEDPTVTPRLTASSSRESRSSSLTSSSPRPTVAQPPETNKEVYRSRSSSTSSSSSVPFEPDEDDTEEEKEKPQIKTLSLTKIDKDIQTDRTIVREVSVQTESMNHTEVLSKTSTTYNNRTVSVSKTFTAPLVKTLLDQPALSALPIISFCQPFSMTSHLDDIILAMPRHLMIINNQSSVSVYPWQQPIESPSTILECFWCSFLYKLLVTTLEDNLIHIYDFISVVDAIKLRGKPLSVKHQSYHLKEKNSSFLLPSSSRYQPTPAIWSQTRFTKSNSLGIYYCYISDRQCSCMLSRIDHNTRKHIKSIDCSGGGHNNNTRVCAMGLSDDRVAVALTNLIMTLYDAETLLGLRQINLSRASHYNIGGVCSVVYLWKTWLILDPIENKIIGLGKRKRQFTKILPEQPVNACSMDDGTLALWLGYPGGLFFHNLKE